LLRWVRLATLINVVVAILVAVGLIKLRFDYPILPLWALPPGIPRWWGILCSVSLGTAIVLAGVASKYAVLAVREFPALEAELEQLWRSARPDKHTHHFGDTRADLLEVLLLFLCVPLLYWTLLVYSIWRVILDAAQDGRILLSILEISAIGIVFILQSVISDRAKHDSPSRPSRVLLISLGGAIGTLVSAPFICVAAVLTPAFAVLGAWLSPSRSDRRA
jgi:hypothetical protein